MPQSLANILVHAIFSTKDRQPFFHDRALRDELHRYLGGIANQIDCNSIIVGGIADHVHLLTGLSRTCTAAELIKELKRGSSIWIKTKGPEFTKFSWQSGYGIFSVSYSQIEAVQKYIANQEEHHRTLSFQDEMREFFKHHHVAFDERHVWD
jgi:REP element-mobilizing transposase RayT